MTHTTDPMRGNRRTRIKEQATESEQQHSPPNSTHLILNHISWHHLEFSHRTSGGPFSTAQLALSGSLCTDKLNHSVSHVATVESRDTLESGDAAGGGTESSMDRST